MDQLRFSRVCFALSLLCSTVLGARSWAGDKEDEEGTAIIKMVQESQRAGRERGDVAGYMAIWTADAKIILARSEKPGKFDTVMTRPQFEALARLLYRGPRPKGVEMEFANERVHVSGDKAVMRYRTILKQGGGVATADEIFRLRKTNGKWAVFENRYWPVERRWAGETTEYSAATWKRLDADVERHRQNGDLFRQTFALLDACRPGEAHAVAKKLTQQWQDNALAWLLRGHAAISVADVEDALTSFHRALEIDEEADVPAYIRGQKQE